MSRDLPLDPHDPVPSGNEPLHLAQQFDRCFEVVGGVPSRLKLPRDGSAADDKGGIDLHHVGPEGLVAEEPLQVLQVTPGVRARKARHHVGRDLQPRVPRGPEGSDGIIHRVPPVALCEHVIPQGLYAYFQPRHSVAEHRVDLLRLAPVGFRFQGEPHASAHRYLIPPLRLSERC